MLNFGREQSQRFLFVRRLWQLMLLPGISCRIAHSVARRVAVSSSDFYPKSPVNIKNIIHGSAVESFRK